MIRPLLALLCLLPVFSAANTNDYINAYQARGLQQAASIPKATLNALKTTSDESLIEHQPLIAEFLSHARTSHPPAKPVQAAPGAILFVSFSMPESLLFALADEAAAFDIPVVVNGLVDNDFKKTIERFARLHRDAKTQHRTFKGLSIDPLWFEQFHITQVPALVLSETGTCAPQTLCANQPFDVVYGNASIKQSLSLIRDKGDAAPKLARAMLEQGHV